MVGCCSGSAAAAVVVSSRLAPSYRCRSLFRKICTIHSVSFKTNRTVFIMTRHMVMHAAGCMRPDGCCTSSSELVIWWLTFWWSSRPLARRLLVLLSRMLLLLLLLLQLMMLLQLLLLPDVCGCDSGVVVIMHVSSPAPLTTIPVPDHD